MFREVFNRSVLRVRFVVNYLKVFFEVLCWIFCIRIHQLREFLEWNIEWWLGSTFLAADENVWREMNSYLKNWIVPSEDLVLRGFHHAAAYFCDSDIAHCLFKNFIFIGCTRKVILIKVRKRFFFFVIFWKIFIFSWLTRKKLFKNLKELTWNATHHQRKHDVYQLTIKTFFS